MQIKSLYIHVPFCSCKCDYCAFYSIPETNQKNDDIDRYIDKLESEFSSISSKTGKLETIFIGGGTPTLLNKKNMKDLFALLNKYFLTRTQTEITIESTPSTLSREKLDLLKSLGINRISVGIQSFNPILRKTIGRRHDLNKLNEKLLYAKNIGINNINVDLIYGIPGQTLNMWKDDLAKATLLPITHLSVYELSFESPRLTFLHHSHSSDAGQANIKHQTSNILSKDMWLLAGDYLKDNEMHRYEISNYAKPGHECKHNLKFWQGNAYLGCGPGAVSFDGKQYIKNPENLESWLNGVRPEKEKIAPDKRAREILILSMRTTSGITEKEFQKLTKHSILELAEKEINKLIQDKLLIFHNERLKPTEKGLLFADTVAETLI